MQKWAVGLSKLHLAWPNCTGECGATTTQQITPNCVHTRHVCLAHFYMAVRPGQHVLVRKRGLTASTSTALGASSTFSGRTEWQIQMPLNALASQPYSPFSVRDISDRWAKSVIWILVASLRTWCMVNWVRVLAQLDDHTSDSKISASETWSWQILAPTPGKAWQRTGKHGGSQLKIGVERAEKTRYNLLADKWARRKVRAAFTRAPSSFTCSHCASDCQCTVGLVSSSRKCSQNKTLHMQHHCLPRYIDTNDTYTLVTVTYLERGVFF